MTRFLIAILWALVLYCEGDVLSRFSYSGKTDGDKKIPSSPYFDLDESGNVTAVLGKAAYLNCQVKNLKNRTVSWVRPKDNHLLTVGRYTYTSDLRFRAIHRAYSESWMLEIKPTTQKDSGRYECQISTSPPRSHIVYLKIAGNESTYLSTTSTSTSTPATMTITDSIITSDLWQKETGDKYCEFHDQLTRDVTSQLECQAKCESKEGCVGIAYSHEPAHIDICFVCLDDSLSSITNQFAFYRRPESNQPGSLSFPDCHDQKPWCRFADCTLHNVQEKCPKTCNTC